MWGWVRLHACRLLEDGETEYRHLIINNVIVIFLQALAWCPWQRNVLASGGGTADRHIHFWNASTGVNLHSVDTGSQVCCKVLFESL